jgi:hypothetical protein
MRGLLRSIPPTRTLPTREGTGSDDFEVRVESQSRDSPRRMIAVVSDQRGVCTSVFCLSWLERPHGKPKTNASCQRRRWYRSVGEHALSRLHVGASSRFGAEERSRVVSSAGASGPRAIRSGPKPCWSAGNACATTRCWAPAEFHSATADALAPHTLVALGDDPHAHPAVHTAPSRIRSARRSLRALMRALFSVAELFGVDRITGGLSPVGTTIRSRRLEGGQERAPEFHHEHLSRLNAFYRKHGFEVKLGASPGRWGGVR